MYLQAIGTALPERRYTKAECWEAFAASDWFHRLDERSRAIARVVLHRDNGIVARRLAVDSLEEVFDINADTLHRRFCTHAPRLSAQAGRAALKRAGIEPGAIDAVIVTTCTGYLCPGLSSYAIESLGLRSQCAGIRPGRTRLCRRLAELADWRVPSSAPNNVTHILSICVEVSSAAMYLDDDPGVLISACLFGDGAGAAVLSRHPRSQRRGIRWEQTVSLTRPAEREALRFEQRGGLLRNVLTRAVPRLAAEHADEVLASRSCSAPVSRATR